MPVRPLTNDNSVAFVVLNSTGRTMGTLAVFRSGTTLLCSKGRDCPEGTKGMWAETHEALRYCAARGWHLCGPWVRPDERGD